MRVNESGNRFLRRDAEDLDHLSEPRPRMAGAARQRSARPSPEAATRRSSKAVFDEAACNAIEGAMDETTDDAPSRSTPRTFTTAEANARLLARLNETGETVEAGGGDGAVPVNGGESSASSTAITATAAPAPPAPASSDAPNTETPPTVVRDFDNAREADRGERRTFRPVRQEVREFQETANAAADTDTSPTPAVATPAVTTPSAAPSTSPSAAPPAAFPAPAPAPAAATNTSQATMSAPSAPAANERPVDAAWLQRREAALATLRTDYRSALAQAQTDIPVFGDIGPGWVAAATASDINTGQIYSPTQAMLVQVNDPNAPDELMGWDEGSPIMRPHPGVWLEFSEAAFAATLRDQAAANPSAALQTLATSYSTSAASVFAEQPSLWALIETTSPNPALNAGPAPAGFAMASAQQLGMTDLYLADPQIAALINAYGGTEPSATSAATSPLAQEQVRQYGQNRYTQLSRLDIAMQTVREQYGQALLYAQARGTSPGWVDRQLELTSFSPRDIYDDGGIRQANWAPFERVFDSNVFTAWYIQQPALANRAFAGFYGASHTTWVGKADTEFGGSDLTRMAFDNPHWTMDWSVGGSGLGNSGASFTHKELASINLNDPPDLHHVEAVGFDFDAGWSTAQANVARDADWLETAAEVAFIVGVGIVTSGAMAGFGFGGAGASLGSAAIAGAAVGTTTSMASGLIHDNLSFKNVLRGALSGALTAGLLNGVESALGPLDFFGKVAANTGVQGLVQAGLGGSFKDGALAGFAAGLGQQIAGSMLAGIDIAVADGAMTAVEAGAAKTLARMLGSAIRTAATPGDANQAFANAFLGDVMGTIDVRQAGQPVPGNQASFDDNGRALPTPVAPGVAVNPTLPGDGSFDVGWNLNPGISGGTGLRLSADTVAQFQAAVQQGIELAAAQPDLDPAAFAQQRYEQLLAEGPSSIDFADANFDDDHELVAGAGGGRARLPSETKGAGLQLSINNRTTTAFELLSNAPVSDAFGLIPEAYRDIKLLGSLLEEVRLLNEVKRMQAALGQAGFDVTPQSLGVKASIDANGRIGYDSADMADRYANAVRLLELSKRGVIELDTKTFTVTSVGIARITPDALVSNVEQRYQDAFKLGFAEATTRLANGERLRYPVDMPQQLQIGLEADRFGKNGVAAYLKSVGLPEGPGQIVALNRWAYDRQGSGFYVRPDVLIDFGPNYRHWIDGKSSYVNDGVVPKQLQDFFRYTGSQTGTVTTPVGSISVKAPVIPKRKP